VRSVPQLISEDAVLATVEDGWGLRLEQLRYVPEGAGAYHWIGRDQDGRNWFVTCDDLDIKPWLGPDRDSVYDGLCAAYRTAADLRAAGLNFVAAPVAAPTDAIAQRMDDRHSVSIFEVIDGASGRWGQAVEPQTRDELVTMLADLHRAPTSVRAHRLHGLEVAARDRLEVAIAAVDEVWDAGPLSEQGRKLLAPHVDMIAGWLAQLDQLAADVLGDGVAVVTHGEPHPGNVMTGRTGLMLVDWDTVAMARPERDLWMLVEVDDRVARTYQQLTGVSLDPELLAAYRRLWATTDLAMFAAQLLTEHADDADTRQALSGIGSILEGDEPQPYFRR